MRARLLVLSPLVALIAIAGCADTTKKSTDTALADTADAGTLPNDTLVPSADTAGSADTAAPADTPAVPKPEVKIPATLPTELVITDLVEGTGPGAVAGDQVVVNYVGVRSADGTEFDNSYDKGQPFAVSLGAGGVIAGWDQGLVGAKQGGRRQLDIPADLAYGDNPQGGIIQPGDALTFVIDVVAVIPAADPANAPTGDVSGGPNVTDLKITDITVGTGAALEAGKHAVVQIVSYRGDTGAEINSTWDAGTPFDFVFGNGEAIPGFDQGLDGMKVGGRRQILIPYALAFGDAGRDSLGLPPAIDLVVIIDLVATY